MMIEPPTSKDSDEICSMCKRPKSKHTTDEMTACSRKMTEFRADTSGGAGIE